MKTTLCLSLLIVALVNVAVADITAGSSYFLVETWYTTDTTLPANLSDAHCCMPKGTVTISSEANSSLILSASKWTGDICEALLLDEKSSLVLPYSNASSYNDIHDQGIDYNGANIGFYLSKFDASQTFSNSTQEILVGLGMDFSKAQDEFVQRTTCLVTLSRKSSAIISAFGAGFIALSALFFL